MINQTVDLQHVVTRLTRVEKENRWFKRLLAALLLVAIALLVMGQARVPSRKIEAQKFVLVDAAGREQAVLQSVGGLPSLDLINPSNRIGASFSLAAEGPSLMIGDVKNAESILISSYKGLGPSIEFSIPPGKAGGLVSVMSKVRQHFRCGIRKEMNLFLLA